MLCLMSHTHCARSPHSCSSQSFRCYCNRRSRCRCALPRKRYARPVRDCCARRPFHCYTQHPMLHGTSKKESSSNLKWIGIHVYTFEHIMINKDYPYRHCLSNIWMDMTKLKWDKIYHISYKLKVLFVIILNRNVKTITSIIIIYNYVHRNSYNMKIS